jgi:hypothetical protein
MIAIFMILLHMLPLLLPEVMPMDPLVLYIPNRVELGLNEGFEILALSYKRITLQPKCLCVVFPLG